ncbi:MAG: hypothetical protein E7165_01420 [Firmicutes bacterium]|nr:hypothetical protein [Bacillota bacterium]
MAKIKCVVNLKENDNIIFADKRFYGIKTNNKISYQEEDVIVAIFINDNKILMKRVKEDSKILLEFEENVCTIGKYFINNDNLWLPLDIFTDKILVDDSYMRIAYNIKLDNEPTKFLFEIRYEVEQ